MVLPLTVSKAQGKLVEHTRARRLSLGLTQEGLGKRAGVSLPTLRKFEQKGVISLESFLKLMLILNALEEVVSSVKPVDAEFLSIDDVLKSKKNMPKKGWRT